MISKSHEHVLFTEHRNHTKCLHRENVLLTGSCVHIDMKSA